MEDLAVQGQGSDTLVCERCFALLEQGAEFCGECGAPVADEPRSEGSDIAIYPLLARANLLRMRGEYKGAEDVCLGILRRFPNNATANGLLGDICAERGDLEQASEWYELALDLTPDDEAVQRKLDYVKTRVRDHEAAETAKQLGLPTSRPKVGLYVTFVVLFLVGSGVLAYVLGRQAERQSLSNKSLVVDAPLTLEPNKDPKTGNDASVSEVGQTPAQTPLAGTEEDRKRMDAIQAAIPTDSPAKSRLLEVRSDPRTDLGGPALSLTFELRAGEEPRSFALALASAALEGNSDLANVTLRGVRLGKLVYVANAVRGDGGPAIQREWSGEPPPADANATPPVETHVPAPSTAPNTTGTANGGASNSTAGG